MKQNSELTDEQRSSAPALSMKGVETSFFNFSEGRFTVGEISLTLMRGYILGVIGRNGAGKTTLLRLILQSVKRKKGEISVAGFPYHTHATEAKQVIGYVGEDMSFLRKETVLENGILFGSFYKTFDLNRYKELLERLEVSDGKFTRELTKGETVKAQLAFALSHKPELLLLDEPTGGLDPIIRREVLTILQEELFDERMSIVFSTHITDDLDSIADYIAMLEKGKLLFCESKEELKDRLRSDNGQEISLKQLMIKYCKGEKK